MKSNQINSLSVWQTNANKQCLRAVVLFKTTWKEEDIWSGEQSRSARWKRIYCVMDGNGSQPGIASTVHKCVHVFHLCKSNVCVNTMTLICESEQRTIPLCSGVAAGWGLLALRKKNKKPKTKQKLTWQQIWWEERVPIQQQYSDSV